MHISEGILPLTTLAGGYAASAFGVAMGLRTIEDRQMVRTAMLSSAFFVTSFIHIPLGPTNIHLVLNGLVGLLAGWACFIAIGIALLLQALLFQFGGITTLGVNTLNMALPALACYLIFSPFLSIKKIPVFLTGFLCGSVSVFLSALFLSLSLVTAGESFIPAAKLVFATNIPLMFVDGLITALALQFIEKVKPEMLTS
ncbi:MAG: cobalt transporter CbiM [Chlorobiales bacterium]|nr:cobalt transporter CbiM [Chlorobiales bacterium]